MRKNISYDDAIASWTFFVLSLIPILTHATNFKRPFLNFAWLIYLFIFLLLTNSNENKVSDIFNTMFQLKVMVVVQ